MKSQHKVTDSKLKDIHWELQQRKHNETIRNVAMIPIFSSIKKVYDEKQLGFLETVAKVADEELSFVRVGDGELRMALDVTFSIGFQKNSLALHDALMQSILEMRDHPSALFGTPHFYRDLHWATVWSKIWTDLEPLLEPDRVLGNAHVSRPVFFQSVGQQGVEAWRRVWDGKRVAVVTGKTSRFELIPALFDNVKSVTRIDSVDKHAFDDLPRLKDEVSRLQDIDLFLVALGPAGTVLSSELVKSGRRVVDIGHISDSYQVAFESGAWPETKPVSRK